MKRKKIFWGNVMTREFWYFETLNLQSKTFLRGKPSAVHQSCHSKHSLNYFFFLVVA